MSSGIILPGALNLAINPLAIKEGELIRTLNVERDFIGGWKKRSGYNTFLGTPDNSQVTTLFSWTQNDGTSLNVYRKSGGTLYYSSQGTAAWAICGGGTLTANSHIGNTVIDNTMIIGDGTAATRHTTNGTSFANTTAAPLAEHWTEFQGRGWGARGTAVSGTNTDMFYSTVGTLTDWTTDSSSIRIPGAGRVNSLFKAADRLIPTKDLGQIFRYDGNDLLDLATDLGPSSPYSLGEVEGFRIYLNRKGFFAYGGNRPELISNSVERQIYNDAGEGITGTVFDNAPGIIHRYNYLCGVGTVTDDLTDEEVSDCIMKYDYQLNEWVNWKFANRPYAFCSYKDATGVDQLIFGDNGGQCYQISGTALSDNGLPIEVVMEGLLHKGTLQEKKWNWIKMLFNPGSRGQVQVAITDSIEKQSKKWINVGQTTSGVVEYSFPEGSRGIFCFYKIIESSREARFQYLGLEYSADIIQHR